MSSPARTVLGVTRLCVGALSLASPRTSAQVFGLGGDVNSFTARLFASRELVLATALLVADDADVRLLALLGLGVDATDVVSGLVELGRGRLSTYGAVVGAGGAAVLAALGAYVAREAA
jgi:hypothetical protein